jgi:hypothetical protein
MKLSTTLLPLLALLLAITASALPDLAQAPFPSTNNLNARSAQNYKVKGVADAVDESSPSADISATADRARDSDLLLDPETLETRQQGSCGSPFEYVVFLLSAWPVLSLPLCLALPPISCLSSTHNSLLRFPFLSFPFLSFPIFFFSGFHN